MSQNHDFTTDSTDTEVSNEHRLMRRGNCTYFPQRGAQIDSLEHSQRRRNQFCHEWNPGGQKHKECPGPPFEIG